MTTKHVDVAIIGTGTAGMSAYREVAKHTDSIALIEGYQYGTTCARVGCMPSKLLIAAAEACHRTHTYKQFGLIGEEPQVDGKAVMHRVRTERDRFVGFVKEAVEGFKEEHRIFATASFIDDHTLQLSTGDKIKADRIIIATGSTPKAPKEWSVLKDKLIINDNVFDWQDLPTSVAVVGAGVIGLELAQALHRLGVRVTLFGRRDRCGPLTDPAIKRYGLKVFTEELSFHTDVDVVSVENKNNQVQLHYQDKEQKTHTETFDYLLAATGRRPNLDSINIQNTTLKLDERGIPQYDAQSMRCGDSHIFMAGDVNGDLPILHEAADEGRAAGANAGSYPNVYKHPRRTPLSIVFSDPQIAMVGLSHKQLTEKNHSFATGHVSFEDQGRSRVMLVNKGLMHLYGCHETGLLLGAEMIGPHHEHLAHELAWCIQMHMTVEQILALPFYHPVIEEGLRTALRNLLKALQMGPNPPSHNIDCGPGS